MATSGAAGHGCNATTRAGARRQRWRPRSHRGLGLQGVSWGGRGACGELEGSRKAEVEGGTGEVGTGQAAVPTEVHVIEPQGLVRAAQDGRSQRGGGGGAPDGMRQLNTQPQQLCLHISHLSIHNAGVKIHKHKHIASPHVHLLVIV